MSITRRQFAASTLALSATAWAPAWAQGKTIRIIVPYAAGGPIDVTARALAERVKDSLGTVIIENRPGAGGNLGADLVAKAAPDGLTIGIAATATHAINPWLFAKMPYDASRDFAPITQMLRVPNVLVMNAETAQRLKINTLADLLPGVGAPASVLMHRTRRPSGYRSGNEDSAGASSGEECAASVEPAGRAPRLLDEVRRVMRVKHYAIRTERAYVDWIRRFIQANGRRHPRDLGGREVEAFLSLLAVRGRVAASTQNQALAALLFLYREVLKTELPWMDKVVRAKRPERVPVVLSVAEVKALLAVLPECATINPDGLAQAFTFWGPCDPDTLFAGVDSLPPGHLMTVEADGTRTLSQYWDWTFPRAGDALPFAVRARVRLNDDVALIPDIDLIEQSVREALAA